MLALEAAWRDTEHEWATLHGPDSDVLLRAERVSFCHGPTNRSLLKLARNLMAAVRIVRRFRPDAILSTGAALSVPFFLVGRLAGARLVYVESVTRTESISLSGRIVYPLAHRFFVQWPAAAERLRRAEHAGAVL
jgi:UDP-N-acetylglucosamine:LPS N-acetylglucosamine transferase